MILKKSFILFICLLVKISAAQLPIARDTITVIENGYVLKMPWANGINYSNVSNLDLNADGKKDLVLFDRLNIYGVGRFRCFINVGSSGQIQYKESWAHSYLFPQVSNWAVFKDYNCDGKEDLFCSTTSGIKVYKNISTSTSFGFTLVKPLIYSDYSPIVSNLYASSVGVPGIVDIDGDGDLDILTFSPQGIYLEYHKNMSVEQNHGCDSLNFVYTDNCWGRINESNCQVNFNVCETSGGKNSGKENGAPKTYHAGSCLTCLDSDGDDDLDLIMGDILCNELQYVHNTGSSVTASFTDTTMLYPNYPNKNNTTQAKLNNFPCAYYVDVNDDNHRDLIVTPNSLGSENYKSVWLYKNTSATSTVNFQFVKNNFLQDEMIEVGQNSFPVLFDYDLDGKKDLLIGNYGYYVGTSLNARLTLYRNIGTTSQASYSLVTRDYGSLSTRTLTSFLPINNVMPTVGDIDGDGDNDILFGTSSGQLHWLENTATASTVCNFSIFHQNPFTFTTSSSGAAPQLFDLDNDARLDLLIGMQNGKIAWYRNIGTATAPAFTLMTNSLGNVDVKGDPNLFGYDGYATPFFYSEGGTLNLLSGSFSGAIFQYTIPLPFVMTNSFVLITKSVNGLNEGSQSTVWYEDINNDNKRDLIVGNSGGGLNFFSSNSPFVGIEELSQDNIEASVFLYPNPSDNILNIDTKVVDFQKVNLVMYDFLGKEVIKSNILSNSEKLDVSGLNKGIYFVNITITANRKNFSVTKKIIKE